MLKISPKDISVSELHKFLLGSVGPRPICLAATISKEGVSNLAPFSFFNVFSANPPIAIFSPARSGRANITKDTYNNVLDVAEVVINVTTMDIVHQVSLASSPYPAGVNEFLKSGLTMLDSELIKPKRVAESPVQMECKVNDVIPLGDQGGAGNLVICEVLLMHIKKEILNERGEIDQHKINLVSRMGGNWYCSADKSSMFEITKPISSIGIGVDNIPEEIRNSKVLTGNELGMLGSIETIPDETEVNEYKLMELSDLFLQHTDDKSTLELELHKQAKLLLGKNKIEDAWRTLLAFTK